MAMLIGPQSRSRNYHHDHHHHHHDHHHHLTPNEKTQKIECTCAVDTYVAKSKLPIELNISNTNGSETSQKSRIKMKIF